MPDPNAALSLTFMPHPARPLAGMTVLVVEDSRYASEAIRLMSIKSGARIRRADSLRAAERHLQVYRPTVAIVDLGLPDGSGLDLIDALNSSPSRIPVIIATSGDDAELARASDHGANGCLAKPVESLARFQQTVLDPMPPEMRPAAPRLVPQEIISPDDVALRDDLSHIAEILTGAEDGPTLDYVAQFLSTLARSAQDDLLGQAAEALGKQRAEQGPARSDVARIAGLVQARLEACEKV